jgi:hypothetical protein
VTDDTALAGVVRFCRYAYPPNLLGYCGPDEAATIREYVAAGWSDPGLVGFAQGFEGAWPYLELIAGAAGISDPLDDRVVRAYWVGGPLLGKVDAATLGRHLDDRFRRRMGRHWSAVLDAPLGGSVPHHNFHVFVVYPWLGMLRAGRIAEPLHVLDRCRVRWGEVVAVGDSVAKVRSAPITYDGVALAVAEPSVEQVVTFGDDLQPGDRVSLHWDHACERLGTREVAALDRETARALTTANHVLRAPAAASLG